MKQPPMPLLDRLELAAQACRAAHLLSCEATCREAAQALQAPAPSLLGGLTEIVAEYDDITASFDPRDAEADFVMRGSDWREIRKAIALSATATVREGSFADRLGIALGRRFKVAKGTVRRWLNDESAPHPLAQEPIFRSLEDIDDRVKAAYEKGLADSDPLHSTESKNG